MQTSTILLIVVAVLVVASAGWFLYHLQRSTQLRRRFGPEYERTLSEAGDRRTAESDLVRRAKRLERLEIRPLSPAEREKFLVEWRSTQVLFVVDDPVSAVYDANRLVNDIMTSRGYTSTNTSERMENISAAYPRAVSSYREACGILEDYQDGRASRESLRRALVSYRTLFDELLGESREEYRRVRVS